MLRFLLTSLLLVSGLAAQTGPRTETGKIEKIVGKKAILSLPSIPEGVSGIVIHRYDRAHSAIVASVSVVASDRNATTVRLLPYRGLENPNLPTIRTRPDVGDTVILGYLYDRVLPIVPNQKSLEHARKSFPKLQIIHPDLVAVELAKEKQPIPDRKILQRTCEKFDLGIVMIMFTDGTDFLDCISWVKVAHAQITAQDTEHFKQPFFHRFEEIPTAVYDWSEYKINDFDRFYKKLESEK